MKETKDEKAFIERLLNPQTQDIAYRELVHLYQKPLYNLIRNIVIDHDDAHDVLQNTFIKIFHYLKNFKRDSKLYSWMYRIATNESLNFINERARKMKISNEDLYQKKVNQLTEDVYFEGDHIQLQLQKAIATLPEKQQLVFKMKYFEEIKYEEMSEILETSVGALKASYHHAVKKIEIFLESH
jgi:RNA polymerase sigma-70 factor (ECF subfamily)